MSTQDDINNFNSSCKSDCLLIISAETNANTANRSISVATTNDLPDLSTGSVDPGTIVYVENIKVPVVAQQGCWTGLDNRELRSDFNLSLAYAWGRNDVGQIGNETVTDFSSPTIISGSFTDWCQVIGGCVSVGIRKNGTAWGWGGGTSGQLGNNTTVSTSSPVAVVGGFTDWCQIDIGSAHTVAIRCNGTMWSWGNNFRSRLGDFSTIGRSSPVSVVGGFTDWCQVSAGDDHSLAVRTGGTAWAWGYASAGKLGNNTSSGSRNSPVQVCGGFTDWCQVSGGRWHSLGVRSNGTLYGWGCNAQGQVGDDTTSNKLTPVPVVGGFTDWCQVSASFYSSAAVKQDGTAWGWGCGGNGRIGNGQSLNVSSPVSVVGGFTDWCAIDIGSASGVGIRTNGTIWTWGFGSNGYLGNNTNAVTSSPVSISGGFTDWCQVGMSVFSGTVTAIRTF